MSRFVSYAQNFEDVMLWRALRHVGAGFYIDAGAADPELDSVTCAFYQRGWRGLNIEPAAAPFQRLAAARPRDINLNICVGDTTGTAEFIVVAGGNGLSTLRVDRQAALQAEGWALEVERVPVRRLADLCREHAPPDIHFLKIDVEGAEREVLEGTELHTFRPWVIVVEATEPNSTVDSYAGWEPLLLAAGYRMAYADGLNRFYLASEHEELARAFAVPPNVFDRFTSRAEWKATAELEALRQQAHALTAERDQALQEMWESNRLVGVLGGERQSLLDQLEASGHEHRATVERLADTRNAMEWLERQLATLRGEHEAAHKASEGREALLATLDRDRQALVAQLEAARQQIAATHRSTSWRVTAPLRLLKRPRAGR